MPSSISPAQSILPTSRPPFTTLSWMASVTLWENSSLGSSVSLGLYLPYISCQFKTQNMSFICPWSITFPIPGLHLFPRLPSGPPSNSMLTTSTVSLNMSQHSKSGLFYFGWFLIGLNGDCLQNNTHFSLGVAPTGPILPTSFSSSYSFHAPCGFRMWNCLLFYLCAMDACWFFDWIVPIYHCMAWQTHHISRHSSDCVFSLYLAHHEADF